MAGKPDFMNFQVDHMTILVDEKMYNVAYVVFRNILGATPDDIIYNVRRAWSPSEPEKSLTFATRLGQGANPKQELNNTMVALVQGTEPKSQFSHVRQMLANRNSTVHFQHVALRTPDLLAFHKHAVDRGVNFITPILKDDNDDLIQVFSGEWYVPGTKPTGFFFEFVQRELSPALLKMLEEHNRQSFFRDRAFLGLYDEKQTEYEKGQIEPFISDELFNRLFELVGKKNNWEITESDLQKADKIMLDFGKNRKTKNNA
jgi:hypothetical protein